NTSHLVELCMQKIATYHIKDAEEIIDQHSIRHQEFSSTEILVTKNWLPAVKKPLEIIITSGASCPDAIVDATLTRIASFFPDALPIEISLNNFKTTLIAEEMNSGIRLQTA
ncbi:MAG: hypothetical protein KDD53_05815, partial [Bdellovibrionales bacterium]|nr:hypothetical protein [Bdellovibrionales bacterium]